MAKRIFTDDEEQMIARYYKTCRSIRSLSRAYKVSRDAISGALRRQGVELRSLDECYELHNRFYSLSPYKFDEFNELSAYWLGFLIADGCLTGRNLSIGLKASDSEHLHKFLKFLESETPVHFYTTKSGYDVCTIEVTHKHLANRLHELGLVSHRPDPLQPTKFIPEHLVHHFIRGYWDGDGHVATDPNDGIGFCGRDDLLLWVRDEIATRSDYLDGNRKLNPHPSKVSYLRYSGRLVGLAAFDVMFKDATIWLPRKRGLIESWPPPREKIRNSKGQFV